ncbi:MAG: 30S ribosomal protein S20 [Patescibacteria group bacterium]
MPNTKAAAKGLRQSVKKHAKNLLARTNVKFHFDKAQDLIEKGMIKEAKVAVALFQKAADKAAKVKAITKQRANHKKAALMKQLKKLSK